VVFVLSIVYFSTFGLLAYGVSRLFFGGAHLARIFWTLFAVFALLPMIASALDRTFGGRLRPESRAARWLAGAIRLLYRSQLVALYSSIFLVLLSNVRKRAIYPLLGLMLFGTLAFFLARVAVRRQSEAPWHSAFLRPGSAELLSAHYEDQRPAGGVPRAVPSIQSDVIRDPYVRLFIPYVARRHDPYLERNCPELRPMAEANAGRAALGCLERLHAVALDGQPLAELAFFSYTHPQTGVRGMLSYIPVAELAAGAHLLTVEAVPRPDRAEPPEPHRIRFWR
jgi:hypothetical protein